MNRFVGLVAGALLALNAGATVITSANNSAAFTLSQDQGNGLVLTATGALSVSGFGTQALTVHVDLSNLSTQNGSPLTPADAARLMGFGFGINPNATGVIFQNAVGGGMIDASLDSIPGLAAIQICAWGGNGCSGGATGGILVGGTQTFDLVLQGNWGETVNIDPLGVIFQTATGPISFQCTGTCGANIPEPQSLALVALGLLTVGAIRRRKVTVAR